MSPDRGSRSVPPPADVSNVTIALAALERLGGAERYIDIEDVTLEAYSKAPDRFSWRTKHQYPSQERVRTAFVHANQREQKRGRGPLVVSKTDGTAWKLTSDGLVWVRQNNTTRSGRVAGGAGSMSTKRVRDIRRHHAFEAYRNGTPIAQIARHELAELLVCPPDAPREAVRRKVDRARLAAVDVRDDEVKRFLEEIDEEVARRWS